MRQTVLKCLNLGALLALSVLQETYGQDASNALKTQRLHFYRGKVVAEDYDCLFGTYQKQNAPEVEGLLRSIGLNYHLLSSGELKERWWAKYTDDGAKLLQLGAGQGAFVLPRWIEAVLSWKDDSTPIPPAFSNLNPFRVQDAILQVARSPWVEDFVLSSEGTGGGPETSEGDDFELGVFFDNPKNPDWRQALPRLKAMLQRFFGQFPGASLTLTAKGANYNRFTLKVNGLHSAVLPNFKDAERLEGYVTLGLRFDTTRLFMVVEFDGEYAPMPDGRLPADGRYASLNFDHEAALERFAQQLTAFMQTQYQATPAPIEW